MKDGTDYTSTADLIGKTVVAEAGSAGETTITENADLSQADFISKAVQTDCLMEVAAGTADAAVLDLTLASAMIGEGTDKKNCRTTSTNAPFRKMLNARTNGRKTEFIYKCLLQD